MIILQQLKYFTQIHVRSTRGRNARGRKITGIECLPGEDKVRERTNKKPCGGHVCGAPPCIKNAQLGAEIVLLVSVHLRQ